MPPIEIGPMRPVGAVQSQSGAASATTPAPKTQPTATPAAPAVETSNALAPGQPPVDSDRVAEIRSAIQNGHYPVVPARIGDAMIAAGILLRTI